ncbi:MAG TPA: hypothetical protein VF621_04795, partial [Pyrinomonadaceae bacterium]
MLLQLLIKVAQELKKAFDSAKSKPVAPCPKSEQKWSEEGIKDEWRKTKAGKSVLAKLPKDTKFKAYEKKAGDSKNAYYRPKENAIYIPGSYTSAEAAPTAGHEALHAYQSVTQGRPKGKSDLIEMEVEAKNLGLDIYGQMGKPSLPYNYKDEYAFRERDAKGYDAAVRKAYKKI